MRLKSASINRRELLRLGLGAFAGGLVPGCRSRGRTRSELVPVRVSWDQVQRTVVGLRPFRRPGFRVERESFGGKELIHNYGHGSRGLSLCWGSSELAVEQVASTAPQRCAVIGCGAMGLTTARLLQERGWAVTIYAKDLPPNTTSNVAGAVWTGADPDPSFSAEFLEVHDRVARQAFRHHESRIGQGYGVRWINEYTPATNENVEEFEADPLLDLYRVKTLSKAEHPFPWERVLKWRTLLIETPIFLDRLVQDVRASGGRIVTQEFKDAASVLALDEDVVFNCTGVGARALFGDSELIPIKGQYTILKPQPEVDYITLAIPRDDGILIGGIAQFGEWSLEPDRDAERRYMERARAFFEAMELRRSEGRARARQA